MQGSAPPAAGHHDHRPRSARIEAAMRWTPRVRPDRNAGPDLAVVCLGFAVGAALPYWLPGLPPLAWTAAATAVLTTAAWLDRRFRPPLWVLIGILWTHAHACLLLCSPFPDHLARVPLVVEGRIAAIPTTSGNARRFLLDVEHARQGNEPVPFAGLVRLSWYEDPPPLRAGERWRLPVRLKPRHGLANPGVFDFERWLFAQGIQATGSLRQGDPPVRLDASAGPYWIARMRQDLSEHLARITGNARGSAMVRALTVGDCTGFVPEDWEVLARTGTTHLVAISGQHVGLIAGAVFFLMRWLWSRSARLATLLAAPRAAAVVGALAALGYSGLAGFAVTTQRSLVMLALVFAALLWQRTLRPYHALTVALAGVLLVDPRAILATGFWLSFGAVGLLLFGLGHRLPTRDPWTHWGRAQWVVGVGLLPLLFLLFGRASVIAPLINLIAVPLFSLILLPLVLTTALLGLIPGPGPLWHWPLQGTTHLLGWCMDGLARIAAVPWATLALPNRPIWVWPVAVAGALLLLAPRGLPGRWLGLVLLAPLFLLKSPEPGHGEAWLTLLDVGLGLSAVVQTGEGTLVFDTGPGYSGGFETGSAVVAPFLAARGVHRIDRLVISHADRDHAGGLAGLAARMPIARIDSGEPGQLGIRGVNPCRAGEHWTWSGVAFEYLHPADDSFEGNNASCVLRIEAGGRSILLTGDIEARVERQLARDRGDRIASDVLIAGHHGSRTSTHPEFLDAVAPDLVLFASGYANQFGFPAAEVRARVAERGIPMLDTGLVGAIELRLGPDGRVEGPAVRRERAGHFWTHRPSGWPVE